MNEFVQNIQRVEFVVTLACTGSCKHCSQGDHRSHHGSIDAAAAVRALREVCALYPIASVMAFGGEPLLYPKTVCALFEAAAQAHIPKIDLITNGFFSRDPQRIEKVADALAQSGLRRVLLSVDAFHQETIPLAPVQRFAARIRDLGVALELSPAWLAGPQADNPYNARTRQVLASFAPLGVPVGPGNVIFPSGNARKFLSDYFDDAVPVPDPYQEDPRDVHTLSFSPDGSVLNGNCLRSSMREILEAYRP